MLIRETSQTECPEKTMSEWVHCNSCFYQPDKSGRRFYLTNCSHIFCEKCVQECTNKSCKLCKAQCSTILLGGQIPKEVEALFNDPIKTLQKGLQKIFQSAIQTMEFQKSHQRRLLRAHKQKNVFYENQLEKVKKTMQKAGEIVKQHQAIEMEIKKLKAENEYFRGLIAKKDCLPRGTQKASSSPLASAEPRISPYLRNQFNPRMKPSSPGSTGGLSTSMNSSFSSSKQSHTPKEHSRGESFRPPSFPQVPTSAHKRSSAYNILNQPGRMLVRTPPSGGRLGTVGELTPESLDNTPMTCPRPIIFNSSPTTDSENESSSFLR